MEKEKQQNNIFIHTNYFIQFNTQEYFFKELRMKKYKIISIWIGKGLLICSLVSCVSTTTIRVIDQSERIDPNVKIYVNGEYKGKGEITHSDTNIVGSTNHISLKKKGCRTSNKTLSRSEKLNIGALIGGIFFIIPILWIMGYNPSHTYEFECDQ